MTDRESSNQNIGKILLVLNILCAILLFGIFSILGFLGLEGFEGEMLINWVCFAPVVYSLPAFIFLLYIYDGFTWEEYNSWEKNALIILTIIQIIIFLIFFFGIFSGIIWLLPWVPWPF